ncbi:UDP-N-acetylmuramoyl-tripeptide--D-alanyl-D-alanine ligase [Spirochaetia bacterium]|nr:UDP-N-acetylmuramoyl-tripeptide--D-alanyl-D-alanine ligase [Spirochaetia bacterium]
MLMSVSQAADFCGGEPVCGSGIGAIESVCVDSREVQKGSCFVCLQGTQVDGHKFAKEALEKGAALVIAEGRKIAGYGLKKCAEDFGAALLAVPDTLKALQDAARGYLKQYPYLKRIGITGSSGKTTTKEIAAAIIGVEKAVICNEGNLNSETGLPLSVFKTTAAHQVGIFEMGMNRAGEIGELAAVLKPEIACITNIGPAHIGCIGSLEKIAAEKKAIFSEFSGGETAIIPEDDQFVRFLAEGVKGKVVEYGLRSWERAGGVKKSGLFGADITWRGKSARFPLAGEHNWANALAAISIATEAGAGIEAFMEGLRKVRPLFGRGEIIDDNGITIVRDCYNANPDSMEKAITLCDEAGCEGRKVYVIGQMLELGGHSKESHEKLGKRLTASRADMVFLFGEEMAAASGLTEKNKFVTNDIEELKQKLKAYCKKGDLVLLKGSRGCALERAW